MLDLHVLRAVAQIAPGWLSGRSLHRGALAAAAAGSYADAEQLFEEAARRYRQELEVEALARLRVHQMMVRARAIGSPAHEAETMLEIVRRLNRLDRLESLAAPHDLVDARAALSAWIGEAEVLGATDEPDTRMAA